MAKLRRFAVESLDGVSAGSEMLLPAEESRHVHVLRLKPGMELETLDSAGHSARAVIVDDSPSGVRIRLLSVYSTPRNAQKVRLVLGVAWPKGKRAAVLVEKCAELAVDEIVPVQFERSVVSKDDESEGVVRLRRIASEASKQSRRDDVMSIGVEMSFLDFLTQFSRAGSILLLDPYAENHLVTQVQNLGEDIKTLALVIGPEGGLTEAEISQAVQFGAGKVRMAEHVLRIETAALAAGAICRAILT